ncbi:MAG TPA: AAA family ATPase [Actinomycetota bacterium]|nr:AAA family ATPase [Actinomycetota bacterium]
MAEEESAGGQTAVEDEGSREGAPEMRPAMATKGTGWSGRDDPAPGAKEIKRPPGGTGMRPDPQKDSRFGAQEVSEEFADVEDPLREVPDDYVVDAQGTLDDSKIGEVLSQLDQELVALKEVKTRIREISYLLLIDRLRRSIALEAQAPTLHMSFTGNPGTGKTTVAHKMGEVLYRLGYIRKGHVIRAGRDELVGQYVGHTAPKTREVIKKAMGGVLFIDEAYNIYRLDNERDYGQETVEMLLDVMENDREDLVVIMAGYADKMARFFSDVPGISSRIAHHIDFPDYSVEELMEIAQLMLEGLYYRFSPDGEKKFQEYLSLRVTRPNFANGRSVRNAIDRSRMRQAIRLFEAAEGGRKLTKKDLVTIEAEDIEKSRVFQEAKEQPSAASV